MPTIYRGFVKEDDFRTRDRYRPPMELEFKRRSKVSDSRAIEGFAVYLARICPMGPKAIAWLEVTTAYGTATILRVHGVVTRRVPDRSGHCLVPAGGEWLNGDQLVAKVP